MCKLISEDNKRKHLEFLQNIITRMNTNSFMVKGWAVTLLAAMIALSAKDANTNYILISIIVIPAFWMLDGFFISTERNFRDKYNTVIKLNESEIDYNLTPHQNCGWFRGCITKTLWPFYCCLIICVIAIFLISKYNLGI